MDFIIFSKFYLAYKPFLNHWSNGFTLDWELTSTIITLESHSTKILNNSKLFGGDFGFQIIHFAKIINFVKMRDFWSMWFGLRDCFSRTFLSTVYFVSASRHLCRLVFELKRLKEITQNDQNKCGQRKQKLIQIHLSLILL